MPAHTGEAKMVKKTYDTRARVALKISRAKMWWTFEELMHDGSSYRAMKNFYDLCRERGFRV